MHIHVLDAYRPRFSPVHSVDARVKVVLAGLFVASVALTPDGAWSAYVLLSALVLGVTVASRVGLRFVQARAAVALPFALAAVTVVFSMPGPPLAAISLFGCQLSATMDGIVRFTSILLKSWLSVQMAVVLTASTPFRDLLLALRSLHLPKILVTITGLAYRYLFVIGDEARRMMRARTARSGRLHAQGGRSILWRARVTGTMVGILFLRSVERAERIYEAMMARGYDGEVRTLSPPALHPTDLLSGLPFALALAGIQVLARIPW